MINTQNDTERVRGLEGLGGTRDREGGKARQGQARSGQVQIQIRSSLCALLQLGNALLQLGNLARLGLLLGAAELDGADTRSKVQRADGLADVLQHGGDLDDHQCLGSAAKRVLQEVGELGVTVRHVLGLGRQGVDDCAEGRERRVDGGGLLEADIVVDGATLGDTLRAGKIDEVELAAGLDARAEVGARDVDDEEGVGARGEVVHLRGGDAAVLLRLLELGAHLFGRAHHMAGEALDVVAALGCLMHLQLGLAVLTEKVGDGLVVDLQNADLNLKAPVGLLLLNDREELLERAAVEARVLVRALHREGLARAGLAVGKDADVVAVDDGHDEVASSLEHVLLFALRGEHLVHLIHGVFVLVADDDELVVVRVEACDKLALGSVAVLLDLRTDTAEDADGALEVDELVVQLLAQRHLLLVLDDHLLVLRVNLRQRAQQVAFVLLHCRGNLALQIARLLGERAVVFGEELDELDHGLDLRAEVCQLLLEVAHVVL
eukprot:m.163165 g.163165  ORF g.163165 m.163165 type:complete len:493 (-) comp17107_c0_seq1:1427-2905(-)